MKFNIKSVNQHFVNVELFGRSLNVKTAITETAKCFEIPKADVEKCLLFNTGLKSLDGFSEIFSGKLKKGDLVLNKNPDNSAFTVVKLDGNVYIEQCSLVMRHIDNE